MKSEVYAHKHHTATWHQFEVSTLTIRCAQCTHNRTFANNHMQTDTCNVHPNMGHGTSSQMLDLPLQFHACSRARYTNWV